MNHINSKKHLPIIKCECGAEILLIPDLTALSSAIETHECGAEILLLPNVRAMSRAIELHVAEHMQRSKAPAGAAAEAERVRDVLIAQVLSKASKSENDGTWGGGDRLAKNPQSKDDALEALDFIVNVLKEHEKDLDKLINELATVIEQLGETGELRGKVEKVEEKINNLQKEVTNLISYLSGGAPKEALPASVMERVDEAAQASPAMGVQSGPSVILRCKQWEDFQTLAFQAQMLSFSYKKDEKVFGVDALKGNQSITYSGALPKFSSVLKTWLSKQLDLPEKNILEGALAIG